MKLLPARFDLHVHSVASDGLYSLQQLAELARRSGLAGLAITDHDVLPDAAVFGRAAQPFGVQLWVGVELSTEWQGRGLHLLGYGFDSHHAELVSACRKLQEGRRERWQALVARLKKRGLKLDAARLTELGQRSAPGRMHLARELVRMGHAPTPRSAVIRYLCEPEADSCWHRLPTGDAIALLHAAGGMASLAHPPPNLTQTHWQKLVAAGLDAVETQFPGLGGGHRRFLQERAREYGLLATAGSDFHGDDARTYLGLYSASWDQHETLLTRLAPLAGSPKSDPNGIE